ncbi:MAG: hypothetical protein R8M45_04810 [Ghiorsea sp.]
MNIIKSTITTSLIIGLGATSAWADNANIPNNFQAGTPALAAEVNANFSSAKLAIDDNYSRITAIQLQPGATGLTGAIGATGLNGAVGATGAAGTNGINGAVGPIGLTGAAGTNGINGAVGPIGLTGAAGTNGIDGAVGATGAAGTNGIDGAVGPMGLTGGAGADAFVPAGVSVLGSTSTPPTGFTYNGIQVPVIGGAGVWATKTAAPVNLAGMSSATVNGKVYFLGSHVYDPASDTWTPIAATTTARNGAQVAVIGTDIYLMGGRIGGVFQTVVEIYDTLTDTWSAPLAPLPITTSAGAAAVFAGKIYTFGGWNTGNPRNDCYEYDPALNTWVAKAPLPYNGIGMYALTIGNQIHVFGGANHHVYNPAADTWTAKSVSSNIAALGGAVVLNGIIHTLGGNDTTGTQFISAVHEQYDPATDAWTTTSSPLPTALYLLHAATIAGKIYTFGGNWGYAGTQFTLTTSELTPPAATMFVHTKN